jgi:glycosyltransferase involved in cell wall biosynthesis
VTRTRTAENHFPAGIVKFFEAGDVNSFENAVLDLYKDPQLRKEMSEKGIDFSKTINWSTEKNKYVNMIEKLCSKSYSLLSMLVLTLMTYDCF